MIVQKELVAIYDYEFLLLKIRFPSDLRSINSLNFYRFRLSTGTIPATSNISSTDREDADH